MSGSKHSCKGCSFYKPIGEKGFCFKHSKLLSNSSSACDDFKFKIKGKLKKRKILNKKNEREEGSALSGFDKIKVIEKPHGTEGFELTKKDKVSEKIFIDMENEESMNLKLKGEEINKERDLSIIILVGGLIVLIIILLASGVF